MATGFAATLPQLREETELHKMLADEKMRSEKHKNHYQELKAEHTRLQDEYVSVQAELKTTIEETRLIQDKYKTLLEQARKDMAVKMAEIDELKSQTLTTQRLEMIKLQVAEEVEAPFREKLQRADAELEHFRGEFNKLKYEYGFLKTEYEHVKADHARTVEEMKIRHDSEVRNIADVSKQSLLFGKLLEEKAVAVNARLEGQQQVTNLRREREAASRRQQEEGSQDAARVRTLQRENAGLHLRVKGLTQELEETRAQREHTGMQSDSVLRLQHKQIAEHAANLKALETEKESLKQQVASLQRDLSASTEQTTQLTTRIHDLEKEGLALKSRADETQHRSRVELTNLKMEMLKQRGDLERDRDRLHNEIEDLKSNIDIQKHTITQQEKAIGEKEREAVKRVQAAREEEWAKLHAIESEKMNLETKLQETERRKIDEEGNRHAEREKWEERIRQLQDLKETAEKEALVFKTKVSHQESLLAQLERERTENSELKTRLHRIETQYQTYVSSEQEFIDINERLKSQVSELREDLRTARDEASRARNEQEATTGQQKAVWAEERRGLEQRAEELAARLTDLTQKHEAMLSAQKKRKRKVTSIVGRLKDKVQLQNAKIDQLKIQNEALKKCVPADAHHQLKKQLRDLIRRHQEFRSLLLANGQLKEVTIGDRLFTSVSQPMMGNLSDAKEGEDAEVARMVEKLDEQYEKDVARVKERLDMLTSQQQMQMSELRPVSPLHGSSLLRKKHPRSKPTYSSLESEATDEEEGDTTTDVDKENVTRKSTTLST